VIVKVNGVCSKLELMLLKLPQEEVLVVVADSPDPQLRAVEEVIVVVPDAAGRPWICFFGGC